MFVYLIISIITYSIGRYLFHNIRNLPPTPFPILPVLGHLHLLKKPLHHSLTRLASLHGPIMFLHFGSRRVLVISSPSAAEECLTKNDIVFANRPRLIFGKYLGNNYTNLGWSPYGDHWRNLRKIASFEILSSHRLQTLMSTRAEEVQLLVRRLAMQPHAMVVDMNTAFFELALNVMMRMICGKRLCGDDGKDAAEAKILREMVRDGFKIAAATNFRDYLPFLGKIGFSSMEKKLQKMEVKRDKAMQKLVDELKSVETGDDAETKTTKNRTMVRVLLALQKTEPDYYSDDIIRGFMSVLKKAQTEMDTTVGFDQLVTESDLANLPYLHCIIAETFRMYPPAPAGVPHESSDECFVGGYRVPKGTMLLFNVYAIHRDPSLWPEPDKFKPERFEGMDGFKDGYKLLTFGLGRRSCPGENLAHKIVGLTLGTMIQCFEWDRVSHEPEDMTEGQGLSMPKAKPLMAKCRPRQNIEPLLSQIEVSSLQTT